MLDEKGDPHDFRSCNAINVFDSLLQRDSKGPYKEKQMENASFLRNAIPWKDEMIKGKKKKGVEAIGKASGKLYVLVKTSTALKNEDGSRAKDSKPSTCWEATQPK